MLRDSLFNKLSDLIINRTKLVIILGILFTILMGIAASNVKMKLAFYEMLPKDISEVKSFYRIKDNFGFASAENVIIESKDCNVDQMITCANELAEEIYKFKMGIKNESNKTDSIKIVKRIEYKIDRGFFEKNSFVIQKESDLNNTLNIFSSLDIANFLKNLNDNFEKEYIGDEDKLSSLDTRQMLLYSLNSINKYVRGLYSFIKGEEQNSYKEGIDEFINGPKYFISPDEKLLLMKVVMSDDIPNDYTLKYGKKLKALFKEFELKYPDLWFGATGDAILSSDTLESVEKDFGLPNIISIALIVFILLGAFGSFKEPFWGIVTLILTIFWTVGFVALTIKYLNLISMAFAILLIGLGIDFAIHLISGFQAAEKEGHSPQRSIKEMYKRRGIGIITGGLTTAFAFLTLAITDFSALSEIGIASGVGIIFCMIGSLTIFPALILWNNKGYSITGRFLKRIKLDIIPNIYGFIINVLSKALPLSLRLSISKLFEFSFLYDVGAKIKNIYVAIFILIVATVLSIMSILQIKNIEFEYNFMKLEAEGVMSEVSQNKILKSFEMSPDFSFLIAENLKECEFFVSELKGLNEKSGLIGRIDALTQFVADSNVQLDNLGNLSNFKNELLKKSISRLPFSKSEIAKELERLHFNIVEIGELSIVSDGEENAIIKKCDGITGSVDSLSLILNLRTFLLNNDIDKELKKAQDFSAVLMKEALLKKCVDTIVTINSIPQDIKRRYISKDGKNFLITIYSKRQIFDERILNQFSKELSSVSTTATGGPILLIKFLRMIIDKGAEATIFAIIAIFLLLLIDFRSLPDTIISIIPLLIGVSWLFGIISLLNIKMNFNSLTIFPLILGIGIDDGVHILHRYKREGLGKIPLVLKCTGRSVFLTSLTTAIAFGSMAFSVRRGIASAGLILAIGVMFCFITSIIVLPAIITIYEKTIINRK